MDIKNMPVIGKVTTKELKYTLTDFPSGGLSEHTMPAKSYSVVHIFEDDGQKTYVTNEWYKEYKKVPLFIIESLVDEYEPSGEDVQYNNGGAVKYFTKELQHRLARPSGSIDKELLDKVRYDSIKEDFVGNFGWKTTYGKLGDGYLFKLDDFDQDLMKSISLKPAERIYRYFNWTSAIGGMTPLIKMNLEKGLLYFPIHNDNDDILFETRGVKALWISLIEDKYADGGEVQFIEYKDSEIMFEPHYKEYFVGDEQFSSLEDAQKYIDDGSQPSQRTINAYRHGAMKDGGGINRVYIEFLNKKKNFTKDKKYFNSQNEAREWAIKNFEKFHPDMIKHEFANGGGVGSDKWQIKNEADKYYSINMRTFQPAWNESPDLGYSFVKGEAESIKNKLTELGFAGLSVVEYNPNWWKMEEGGYLHGSPNDFCDTGFKLGAGKGQGENLWGVGHYFTNDEDLATYYAKFIKSSEVTDMLEQKVADKLGFKKYSDIPYEYEKKGIKSKYGLILKLDLYNQYLKQYVDKHKDNGIVYKVTLFPGKDKKDYNIIDFSGENYTDNDVRKKDKRDLKNLIDTLSKNKRTYAKEVKLFFDKKGWEFDLEKYNEKFADTLKSMRDYYKNFDSYSASTPLLYNLGYYIKRLFDPRYFDYAKDYKVIYDKIKTLTDQQQSDLRNEEAYYKGILFTEFIKDAGYDALKYFFSPSIVPYKNNSEYDASAIVVFDDENVEIDNCKVAEDGMMMTNGGGGKSRQEEITKRRTEINDFLNKKYGRSRGKNASEREEIAKLLKEYNELAEEWGEINEPQYSNGGTISDSIDLFFQEGGSDKEYHIQLVGLGDGTYVVNFQFGRRGSKLNSGTKTVEPVPLDKAQKVYNSLKREKMNKGYEPDYDAMHVFNAAATQVKPQSKTVHILPQLLNPIEEADIYINDDSFLAQEKKDHERRIIISDGAGTIMGLNKKGQEVPVPIKIAESIKIACILDGEISEDKYYIFDILSYKGEDLKHLSATQRLEYLYQMKMQDGLGSSAEVIETAYTKGEKQAMFDKLKAEKREGIVFKKKAAPYTSGRPNSGGSQLKFKFYKTATFIVANMTKDKRSVGLELIDDNTGDRVFMGKVTIPPNYDVPAIGDLVEVRYLYAYRGGAVYQPTYLGKRNDSDLTDATMKQIIYKADDEFKDGGSIFTNDGHGNYTNQLGYQLIDQFDGTYQVLDPNGIDISGEYETYDQGKETINEYMFNID
jgi:bifunctional non-homologous end joining protein LigD